MRGGDERLEGFFSYVHLMTRIQADHPLRVIRELVDRAVGIVAVVFSVLLMLAQVMPVCNKCFAGVAGPTERDAGSSSMSANTLQSAPIRVDPKPRRLRRWLIMACLSTKVS